MSKRYQVTLKDDTAQKLEELAKELELSKSAVITLALQMYHEEKRHKKSRHGNDDKHLLSEVIIT